MAGLVALFLVFSPFRWCWDLAGVDGGLIVVVLAGACGAAIALGLRVAPGPRALLSASPILWSLVGLALLSSLWSALPASSVVRAGGLVAAVLLGYYLHRSLSVLQVLRLIFWSMGAALLLSLFVVVVAPEIGVHQEGKLDGAWRGVLAHRNHLGLSASLVFLAASMLASWGTDRERPLAGLALLLAAAMLLPVGSATAVVLVVAAAILVTLGRITDYRSAWRLPALLLIGVTPFLAVLCRGALLPLLGRTPSLNGRVVVWEHMADVVMRRPLLGYGYRLSWTDVPALQIDLVQHGRPWQASMHSGYVSVAFWLGLVGALLLALLLLSMLWSSAKRFRDGEPGVDRTLPLALLVLLLLAAVPEERMLLPASYHTVLLALLAFHLHEPLPRRVVGAGAALVLLCFGIGCQPSSPGLFLGFEEVSGRWGIGELDARGVCILDLENDGDADMLWVRAGGSTLLENEAPGRFADVSEARGISGFGNSLGCAALDLDRDGDTDLLITDNDGPTLLLRNDGSGHFSDATAEAGLADQSGQASIAAADADGDGELDLLLSGVQDKASALLFGDGAGGYVQSTLLPQLDAIQRSWAAAWIDTDNDMLPELFVGTDQPARPGFRDSNDLLLGNLGGREFRDITEEFAIGNSENAMGLAVADVNQDGFLDLYVTNIGHQPLFLSSGNGSFVDTSLSLGLGNHGRAPGWGSFWFDPDDDGLEDLFVVLGGYYGQTLKSESPLHLPRSTDLLFRRLSDRLEFEDQAGDLGLADGAVGRGAVWADLDGDQLLDVVVANIEGGASRVYRNLGVSGGSAAWRVRLRGVLSNPEAIGARAVLTACGRSQQRAVSSGPSLLSQGELTLHFGAGGCREDAELLVRWPSGLVQEWSLPGPGATWDLVEGRDL